MHVCMHMCLCVCVCVHACACVHKCVCVCVCVSSLLSNAFPAHTLLAAVRLCLSLQVVSPSVLGLKTAYQGVPGAYSEVAAQKACPDLDTLPCEQFEVAFQVRGCSYMCMRVCLCVCAKQVSGLRLRVFA